MAGTQTLNCKTFFCNRLQSAPRKAGTARSRGPVAVRAAAGTWLPGTDKPKHLEGLKGNYGFDPLSLGTDKERLEWYVEAEKTNGRWAMAAVAGILGQELLGRTPEWWNVGAQPQWLPNNALTAIEFVVIGHFELKRFQGWNKHKTSGMLEWYPFDPLKQQSDSMETKEIKNGRLAMVAIVGFAVQALVTREQPIAGITAHIADPFGHNIITNVANLPAFVGSASIVQ